MCGCSSITFLPLRVTQAVEPLATTAVASDVRRTGLAVERPQPQPQPHPPLLSSILGETEERHAPPQKTTNRSRLEGERGTFLPILVHARTRGEKMLPRAQSTREHKSSEKIASVASVGPIHTDATDARFESEETQTRRKNSVGRVRSVGGSPSLPTQPTLDSKKICERKNGTKRHKNAVDPVVTVDP
jgi:hypothetical protein